MEKPKRGLAAMDIHKRREIASMGGKKSRGGFAVNRELARIAGKKGGEKSRRGKKEI